MIFVVDSDAAGLEAVKVALEPEGYEVATFDSAESALDLMDTFEEPEMIISEVQMTGMSGFEFKRAFSRKYPNSLTPFMLLTSDSDEQSMGRGFSLGIDDYLVKPLSPKMLYLRVRNTLSRRHHYLMHSFYGDLGKMPFFKLMQFCESKGLTGEVEVLSGEMNLIVSFRAGQMQTESANDDQLLKVYDLTSGTFVIRAMPLDFSEIKEYSLSNVEEAVTEEPVYLEGEKPMGKLSGVQVDKRLFQFQTEFVTQPSNQLVTIVVVDGRVMTKRIKPAPQQKLSKKELEALIEIQHTEVENEVKQKLSSLAEKKAADSDSATERFRSLFESGFEKYRSEDFHGALEDWENAYDINPTDKTLETNIRILRKKLGLE